jgi:hypothetical protein
MGFFLYSAKSLARFGLLVSIGHFFCEGSPSGPMSWRASYAPRARSIRVDGPARRMSTRKSVSRRSRRRCSVARASSAVTGWRRKWGRLQRNRAPTAKSSAGTESLWRHEDSRRRTPLARVGSRCSSRSFGPRGSPSERSGARPALGSARSAGSRRSRWQLPQTRLAGAAGSLPACSAAARSPMRLEHSRLQVGARVCSGSSACPGAAAGSPGLSVGPDTPGRGHTCMAGRSSGRRSHG